MNIKRLGDSDLNITSIGFGAWAIGGSGWEFAWGAQDDRDSIATIHEALDVGINWIDTAAVYGLGHSEEVVARALRGLRDRPYIFTKCSMVWDERRQIGHSLKADSIRRECEASLRRLKVDVIDLYQIHWPDPDEDIEEGWQAMAALKREGKVRNIGVSNFDVAQMKRAQAIAPITSLQPRYSLVHREIEDEILPFVARENIGVIAYSPMASGLLTGAMTRARIAALPADDWRKSHADFREPQLSRNLKLVRILKAIGDHHGMSPGQVAVARVLQEPGITGAIVGARRPGQVRDLSGAADFHLSDREIGEIEAFFARTNDAVPTEKRQHEATVRGQAATVKAVKPLQFDDQTPQTTGMRRLAAISNRLVGSEGLWAGVMLAEPKTTSSVHHHGPQETAVYVVAGESKVRWGKRLEHEVDLTAGDFLFIPPYTPHQEINPSPDKATQWVVVRNGPEAVVVDLTRTGDGDYVEDRKERRTSRSPARVERARAENDPQSRR
jgi:aryl-alcohol dehydrogenase-like predicted oxidoreductase/uncharacterized RmlC-like cupin family protein